jgi:hypothetical protein
VRFIYSELMINEIVGMLWLDAKWGQLVWRKIFQVKGDDGVRIAMDGSRQDVTVVIVRQVQAGYQTKQSATASFIKSLVRVSFSRVRSFRSSKRLEIHSSWISSVHLARKSPIADISIKKSRKGAGYKVHASNTTV